MKVEDSRGAVLGIDVGFSPTRRTSAVCLLEWDKSSINWTIKRFRAVSEERVATVQSVARGKNLLAAAFDGPLRRGLDKIGVYRTAERMLVRRLQPLIGKPGQSSAPVGVSLNLAANECAHTVLANTTLGPATHELAIHQAAIAEAFPSSFMGVLLPDPSALKAARGDRSDTYYAHLAQSGGLQSILSHLLPGRAPSTAFSSVTDHDDRAGLICALTALAVAKSDYCAVGDANGWIILPPRKLISDWAWALLRTNNAEEGGAALREFRPEKGSKN